jgi:hypothetical protein
VTASQDSRFTDVSVLGAGTVDFYLSTGQSTPHDGGCSASGGSPLRLTFDLTEPTTIVLDGTVTLGDWYMGSGTAKVELIDSAHLPLASEVVTTFPGPRTRTFSELLDLPAGRFTLTADAIVSAETTPGVGPSRGSVSYTFAMQVVPEPVTVALAASAAIGFALTRRRYA